VKFNSRRRESRRKRRASEAACAEDGAETSDPAGGAYAAPPAEAGADPFQSFLSIGALLGPDAQWAAELDWSTLGAAGGAWDASAPVLTAHVKLPVAHSVSQLPPPALLDAAAREAMPEGAVLAGVGVRVGCLLLSFDVGLMQPAQAPGFAVRLAASLRRVLEGNASASGAVLRMGEDITVPLFESSSTACSSPRRPPPPLPAVSALCCGLASPTLLHLSSPLPMDCTPVARAAGVTLAVTALGPHTLLLSGTEEALEASGGRCALLMLECDPSQEHTPLLAVSDAVPLLLCASEALCTEVNASGTVDGASLCALVLGLKAGAPLRLRMRAAAACLRQGWPNGLCELLAQAACDGHGDARAGGLALGIHQESVRVGAHCHCGAATLRLGSLAGRAGVGREGCGRGGLRIRNAPRRGAAGTVLGG
jgi:hypothetical protein